MGCFNQSCTLSRLDIKRGDKVLLLPIYENSDSESLNDTVRRLWKPFCLPIVGIYDDYGSIERIKKDKNTTAIEKYFEMTIEQFVEIVSSNHRFTRIYDGPITEVYGNPKLKVTREDLKKAGFVTKDDDTVTHPRFDWIHKLLEPTEHRPKHNCRTVTMKWKDDCFVVSGYHDKPESFKIGSDACDYHGLFKHLHEAFKYLCKHSWVCHDKEFIFGVPEEKQERALKLLTFRKSFFRHDVYTTIVKKQRSVLKKNKYCWVNPEKYQKYHKEYIELVTQWLNDIDALEAMKLVPGEERSDEDSDKWNKLWFASREPYDLVRHIRINLYGRDCFETRIFREMYGKMLLDKDIIKALDEFCLVESAMHTMNALIVETHSFDQHGDIGEQAKFMEVLISIGKKVAKQREF